MEILAAVRLVRLSFGLLLLWGFFYFSIRAYLLDDLRQNLFRIRDDLFDFAADGGIPFDDPSYRELRDDLNSLILFAEKLSFFRGLSAYWVTPRRSEPQWLRRLDQLEPLVGRRLRETHMRALDAVVHYVTDRSLMLLLLLWILRIVALWVNAARAFYQRLPAFAEPLEAQARDEYRFAA
jgi:hypothetical protein